MFRRGYTPASLKQAKEDIETSETNSEILEKKTTDTSAVIQEQTAVFHWKNVCYDIKIKSETRRILDNVDGWVRPGTLTALMVSLLCDVEVVASGTFWLMALP